MAYRGGSGGNKGTGAAPGVSAATCVSSSLRVSASEELPEGSGCTDCSNCAGARAAPILASLRRDFAAAAAARCSVRTQKNPSSSVMARTRWVAPRARAGEPQCPPRWAKDSDQRWGIGIAECQPVYCGNAYCARCSASGRHSAGSSASTFLSALHISLQVKGICK